MTVVSCFLFRANWQHPTAAQALPRVHMAGEDVAAAASEVNAGWWELSVVPCGRRIVARWCGFIASTGAPAAC